MSTLSARLTRAFDPSKHTQAELARAAKVSRPSVSDWFSGETKALKAEPLVRAAKYLQVQALWLATGDGPMRGPDYEPGIGGQVAEQAPYFGRPAWPFDLLSEDAICSLPRNQLLRLEGAMLAAADALGLPVKQPAAMHG